MSYTLDLRPYVHLTEDQFFELCQRHALLKLERTARGEIVIVPPAGGESSHQNCAMSARLFTWAESEGSGLAFDSSAGFRMPLGGERSPDAAWVRRERWDALTGEERRKFPPLCPDFVAELVSPSDSRRELQAKMQEYLDNGARLGWLLDPDRSEVEVYRPGQAVEILHRPSSLSGQDVLPGFVLDLKGILYP